MKKIILVTLLFLPIVISCKKEAQDEYNGIITGYDLRMCACCGGTFITIDKVGYRIESLPPNSGIDFTKDTFPIYVIVSWHKSSTPCLGDEIIIDKIRKQ
jgi:hypothetical protein